MLKLITLFRFQKTVLSVLFFLFSLCSYSQHLCVPVGWATQNGGVTGGGNATPAVVSNYNSLRDAIRDNNIKVVHIQGTINIPSNGRIILQDQSGKTIFGLPGSKLVSEDMTAAGSGILQVKRMENLILQNIHFEGPGAYDTDGKDNLEIDDSRNIWVDHCEFHDGMDGNFDIKNKSDYISVTWCTFSYEKPPRSGGSGGSPDHRYSNLIGSSDGATADRGKLQITFQYCRWGDGVKERMPRVRFGKVHIVNNLFDSNNSSTCIRAGKEADLLIESNVFSGVRNPIDLFNGDYTAVTQRNNLFLNTSGSQSGNRTSFTPPYSLTITPVNQVENLVKAGAGATLTSPTCDGDVNLPAVLTKHGTGASSQTINVNSPIIDFYFAWQNATSVTVSGLPNGITATIDNNAKQVHFSGSPTQSGTFAYTITTVGGNPNASNGGTFTVVASGNPAILTKHGSGPSSQTLDQGTPIQEFYYAWQNATSVTVTGLPTGINANIDQAQQRVTFTGSPTQAGIFTYTVTTTGGDPNTSNGGTFTVNPVGQPAILTKHGSGSSSQTILQNTSIQGFYYAWQHATTVTITGLPTGIIADIDNVQQRITFSGAPTESGIFNYTITTVGGSPNDTKTGRFTVEPPLPDDCNGVSGGSAVIDNCGICAGGTTGRVACTSSVQGEEACEIDGVLNESINQGYVGTGYANVDNAVGTSITYSFNVNNAGNYTINVRYANGVTTNRDMELWLNDENVGNVLFSSTGAWTNWNHSEISLAFKSGVNVLKLVSLTADGGPNIDLFAFYSSGVQKGTCEKDCNGTIAGEAYIDQCDLCAGGTTGVEPDDCVLSANNSGENKTSIVCFPNPSEAIFTIQKSGVFNYIVFDVSGKIIEQGEAANQIQIGQNYVAGSYIVQLQHAANTEHIKVIKK